jgi:hypothetical protein
MLRQRQIDAARPCDTLPHHSIPCTYLDIDVYQLNDHSAKGQCRAATLAARINSTAMEISIFEAPKSRPTTSFFASAFVLAMLVVAAAGYLWMPRAGILLPLVEGCRLDRQTCSTALPEGGVLEMTLEPRPVPSSAPVHVSVVLRGLQPDKVAVDFQGVEMNMGLHRLPLTERGGGRYAGETTLPVCVTGKMVWQATVRLETGRKDISVPFRFESGHA